MIFGICFLKCITHLTCRESAEESLTFIRTEQRRSNVMTSPKNQLSFKKQNIVLVCYDGFRVCPRTITERNIAKYMYKNNFC